MEVVIITQMKWRNLKSVSNLLNTPRFVRNPFLISYLCTFSLTLLVLVMYFKVQPQVPLFYSLARPAEQLAAKEWLFIIPAISGTISFTHLLLINSFLEYDRMILKLFSWSTVGLQVIITLGLLRILFIIS